MGDGFVGDFDPSVIRSNNVEIAVKRFKKGEHFPPHYHKLSEEITVIISGKVRINNVEFCKDDIILQEKMESSDFVVLEDATIIAVKVPGVAGDKYQ